MADELLTDIKGLLEHYFSEQLGEGACDDIAEEILAKVLRHRLDRPELRRLMARVLDKAVRQFEVEKCPEVFDLKVHIDQLLTLIPIEEEIEKQGRKRILDRIIAYLEERKHRSFVPSMITWVQALKEGK